MHKSIIFGVASLASPSHSHTVYDSRLSKRRGCMLECIVKERRGAAVRQLNNCKAIKTIVAISIAIRNHTPVPHLGSATRFRPCDPKLERRRLLPGRSPPSCKGPRRCSTHVQCDERSTCTNTHDPHGWTISVPAITTLRPPPYSIIRQA